MLSIPRILKKLKNGSAPYFFASLKLNTGHFLCPHPEKVHKGGEDSLFVGENLCAVADGVGGWIESGVDPAKYSKELCSNIGKLYNQQKNQYTKDPRKLIIDSAGLTKSIGSSTCCILSLDPDTGILHSSYIGDSGYMIFRKKGNEYGLFFESEEQTHDFNFPFQIGTGGDNPITSLVLQHQIEKEDILVVGTDGLFDNVDAQIILSKINELTKKQAATMEEYAEKIAKNAYNYSLNKNYISPFEIRAKQHGLFFRGGKSDDITIIVAKVEEIQ